METPTSESLSPSSSSSSESSTMSNSPSRCEGLDLLVKAVYCILTGSAVGVPYFQRRVIRRGKRPIRFTHLIIPNSPNPKRVRKTQMIPKIGMPSKYQHCVSHQWKPPRECVFSVCGRCTRCGYVSRLKVRINEIGIKDGALVVATPSEVIFGEPTLPWMEIE